MTGHWYLEYIKNSQNSAVRNEAMHVDVGKRREKTLRRKDVRAALTASPWVWEGGVGARPQMHGPQVL